MKAFCAAMGCMLWAAAVQAQAQHSYVAVAFGKSVIGFVDADSIKEDLGNIRTAWALLVDEPPMKGIRGTVQYSMIQERFDCSAGTAAITYNADYDQDGKSLNSGPVYLSQTPVVPDSVEEAALNSVCGGLSVGRTSFDNAGDAVKVARRFMQTYRATATILPKSSKDSP